MLMVAILLLGLIGYELLPVAALPNIDSPTIPITQAARVATFARFHLRKPVVNF
jgi:multidrug efflux pump subunit AcrB